MTSVTPVADPNRNSPSAYCNVVCLTFRVDKGFPLCPVYVERPRKMHCNNRPDRSYICCLLSMTQSMHCSCLLVKMNCTISRPCLFNNQREVITDLAERAAPLPLPGLHLENTGQHNAQACAARLDRRRI
jgi:hypothetical protein